MAQNDEQYLIDSLRKHNQHETNQEQLIDNYNLIAFHFGSINIDSSLYYSGKAKYLAKESGYQHGLAISHSYSARGFIEKTQFKKAIENFHSALDIFIQEEDSVNILDCYRGLSYVASYGTSQLQSLSYDRKALQIAEHLKDSASLSIIYNNIGTVYKKLNDYETAKMYFEKSLALVVSSESALDLAIGYSNLGTLKVDHEKFEVASADYQKVLELLPQIENQYIKAYLYLSLARYHNALKDFESAEFYIDDAHRICSENNFQHILPRVYRRRGEMYLKQERYKECVRSFDRCLELSNSIGIQEEFSEIYKMKASAYSRWGRYEEAFKSSIEANNYSDSLKDNKVALLLGEFEHEQKTRDEIRRQQLEKTLKDQQAKNEAVQMRLRFEIAIITIFLLLLIIVTVVYFFNKTKGKNKTLNTQHQIINQQKQQLEENIRKLELSEGNLQKLNATKDKFFSIISHDLKSPFNAILGFSGELANSYDQYDDEDRKMMIEMVNTTSKSTFKLLENLLTWSRSQSGFIEITKEPHVLRKLVEESISPYLGAVEIKSIRVRNEIPGGLKILADKETIKVVISNLFNNAIKYNKEGGEIALSCEVQDQTAVVCTSDTGIGMSKEIISGLFRVEKNVQRPGTKNEQGTGLGLILCHEFVHKNDGEIKVKSAVGKGSEFYISLPVCEE